MPRPDSLEPDQYYHIYNRGNSGESLFREARNYRYFLKLYAKYIEPIAETYAYCLLSNHFHFLVRIKDWQSFNGTLSRDCQSSEGMLPRDDQSSPPSRAFANLFSTYKGFQQGLPAYGQPLREAFPASAGRQ